MAPAINLIDPEYFAAHGQKNVLCVNTLPGSIGRLDSSSTR